MLVFWYCNLFSAFYVIYLFDPGLWYIWDNDHFTGAGVLPAHVGPNDLKNFHCYHCINYWSATCFYFTCRQQFSDNVPRRCQTSPSDNGIAVIIHIKFLLKYYPDVIELIKKMFLCVGLEGCTKTISVWDTPPHGLKSEAKLLFILIHWSHQYLPVPEMEEKSEPILYPVVGILWYVDLHFRIKMFYIVCILPRLPIFSHCNYWRQYVRCNDQPYWSILFMRYNIYQRVFCNIFIVINVKTVGKCHEPLVVAVRCVHLKVWVT